MRGRRAERRRAQDLHPRRDDTAARQRQVERVLVLGVTGSTFSRDELVEAFAGFEADGRPRRRDQGLGSMG